MFFPRHRPARTLTQLFELRKERDAQLAEKRRVFGQRALARVKARYDADPGNLLYGGGRPAEDTPLAMWTALYPHLLYQRYVFGSSSTINCARCHKVTKPTWPAVFTRSLEMATRAATITAIRHLFDQAEIARLKHGGEMSKYSARDYCARVTDENS
jgi:hypothetical protein